MQKEHNQARPQLHPIGGEASGEDSEDGLAEVDLAVEEEEETVVAPEEQKAALDHMILWLAIVVGFVAIWPVTVPKIYSHREVAVLALPVGSFLNPCTEAQKDVAVEDDRSDSVHLTSCMTTRVINTPSTMQGNYMCHLNLDRLLSKERMRRKLKMKQKTKKVLCQCGSCKHHNVFC